MKKNTESTFQFTHPDNVFIDNISLTYSPKKSSDKEHIHKAVDNEEWLKTWAKAKPLKGGGVKYLSASANYHTKVELLFPDDTFVKNNTALLEMNPRNPATPFLRLEYNPEKISLEALTTCLNAIMPQDGINPIFDHGTVTRLDISLDIKQVFPYQIILDYMKMQFRTVYFESGVPTSIYIGKDTGVTQMYMYDKLQEMKDKEYQINPLSDYQLPTDGLTRIEIRHRPKGSPKFSDMFHLPNLYEPMRIAGTPPKVKGDKMFDVMRDLCVLKGARHVVKQLGKQGDVEFSKKLEKYSIGAFLDIHQLWSTLPNALLKVYPHGQ